MRGRVICRDGVKQLMSYTEGLLPAPQRLALEGHVQVCVRCRRFVRWYRETPAIVRAATALAMPPEIERRLRRTLAAAARRSGLR